MSSCRITILTITSVSSTAQTAYLIEASKDMKLDVWKKQLGTDAPDTLIVPEPVDSLPAIEGNALEVKYSKDDSAHPFVWIPSLKAIIGGGSVTEGVHIWMADTQGDKGIERWQQVISAMKQLEPATVVPAHYVTSDYKPAVLDFVEKYLADYRQAAAKSNNADELTAAMEKAWLQLPGKDNLVFSAKVFKGEQEWKIFTPYPPIGRAIKVDFGAFMVYWSEPNSTKSNVVHVQNYNTGTVWTNIAAPDGKFYNMQGKMSVVE